MPQFTDQEGQSDHFIFYLKVVYMSFTIQLVLLRVLNVKVKNLAFDTSQLFITNAWFSMKNYGMSICTN